MEDLLKSILQSPQDSLLESLIISDLKRLSKYDPFDSQHEVKILLSYYKASLSFCKTSLHLPLEKQLLFLTLSNKLICEGTIKKPRSSLSDLKNSISSFSEFFNPSDLTSISTFFTSSYFQQIRLYNYIFSSEENTETTHVKAWIDEPLSSIPLQHSVQRIKNRIPIEEIPEAKVQTSRTRSRILGPKRPGDSKEHLQETVLESKESELFIVDPVEETMQKIQVDLENELQKREAALEAEIEEVKKRYR